MASDPFSQLLSFEDMGISNQKRKEQSVSSPSGTNPANANMPPKAQSLGSPVSTLQVPSSPMSPGYPMQTPGYPMQTPGYSMQTPGYPMQSPGYPMQTPGYPMQTPPAPHAVNPYMQMQAQTQQPQLQNSAPSVYAQNPMYASSATVAAPAPAQVPPMQALAPAPAQAAPMNSFDPFSATPPTAPAPMSPVATPAPVAPVAAPAPMAPVAAPAPMPPAAATATTPPPNAEGTNEANAVDITSDEADFWAQMGFAVQEESNVDAATGDGSSSSKAPKREMGPKRMSLRASIVRSTPNASANKKEPILEEDGVDDKGLPAGGKYYEITLSAGNLGAAFVAAEEMGVNLFSAAPESFIKTLGRRPILGFTSTKSILDKVEVSVGDVVIKVEDQEVNDTKSVNVQLLKERNKRGSYRNIHLHMWKPPPSIHVTHAENQCVVEYHSKSVDAPKTNADWKSKYVVVGGIAADPWVMNMYYTKGDYDKAIANATANKPNGGVKVKSFSLICAQLVTPEPKSVHYLTQGVRRPWHYIVVTTLDGKAIKIGHPLVKGLDPVIEGIKKAISHTKTYKGF